MDEKMDAERAAFEAWADSQWPGAKRQQLKRDNYGEYLNCIYRDMWRGWQARASLPVGVPDGLLARIDSAIKAFTSGRASMHVPPEPDDVDMVLGECRALVNALIAAPAAPTVKAEQVPTVKLEWFQSPPGPDDSGDCTAPALPAAGSPDLTAVRCQCCATEYPHNSYDAGFIAGSGMCQVCDAAMPPKDLPAAGSAVEEVEVVGYRFFHVDHGYIFRRTHIYEGNPSLDAHSLMTVAQHERIVAALSAQQCAPAYGSYTTRPAEAVAGIALRQLGDESRWVEIRDLNAHAFPDIGPHDYYPVGTVLRMPAEQQYAPERVSVPVELLQDLHDLASDAVEHHRAAFAGYKLKRQANMEDVVDKARAILESHAEGGKV